MKGRQLRAAGVLLSAMLGTAAAFGHSARVVQILATLVLSKR